MKLLLVTWITFIVSTVHAEEDSTSPPYSYGGYHQGGSKLYPTLTGVADYTNRNNYNNQVPGQNNNYNSNSRYPYVQPGNNQPYPIGTGPYNMSYSGYPGGNANGYNSSQINYPNSNYRPGSDAHRPFGNPKPISNPHQPFGTPISNPYQNVRNSSIPNKPMNENRYPGSPTNPSYPYNPNYPSNHGTNYPSNSNYPSNQGTSYPTNLNNRTQYPVYPQGSVNQGYGNNRTSYNPSYPGGVGYHPSGTSSSRQTNANKDPHRPFGQPSNVGSSNNYHRY